ELLEMLRAIHCTRVVIVQPSVYGVDNACTVAALRKLGPRARGVAVIDKSTSRDALQALHESGIRGVRLNLETVAEQIDSDAAKKLLNAAVEQIHGLDWHIQIFTRPAVIEALANSIGQLPVPVVFDHFGGFEPATYASQPGFARLIELLKSGRIYVKVSGAYM